MPISYYFSITNWPFYYIFTNPIFFFQEEYEQKLQEERERVGPDGELDAAKTFYEVAGGSRNRQVGLGNIARHPDYKKGK